MQYRQPTSSLTDISWVAPAFEMHEESSLAIRSEATRAKGAIFLRADMVTCFNLWIVEAT